MKIRNYAFLFLIFGLTGSLAQNLESILWINLKKQIDKNPDSLYVVNFWATWCKPCVQEMPDLWEETEKFKDRKIRFIPISLNFPEEAQTKVIPFIEKNFPGKKFYILNQILQSEDITRISSDWGGGIPYTIIFYKKKKQTFERKLKKGELEEFLNKLI
jgi:thiol-disulfide isomerase/thioredoxin